MGTIAEKLTYLNETKNAIKEAIVNKGVSVNDSDTFRSYADKISSIEAGGGSGGDAELEASFISSIDDSLGANVTKLPSGLTSIKKSMFYMCSELTLTELPDSITSIGYQAFGYCSKLAITKLPEKLTTLGDSSFFNCTGLTTLEIPSGITVITSGAFRYCSKLAYVHIKGDITEIESYAFNVCGKLTTLILSNVTSVPTLVASAFTSSGISKGTGYIYVPDDLVESFKTATNWETYANQIKGLSELPVE